MNIYLLMRLIFSLPSWSSAHYNINSYNKYKRSGTTYFTNKPCQWGITLGDILFSFFLKFNIGLYFEIIFWYFFNNLSKADQNAFSTKTTYFTQKHGIQVIEIYIMYSLFIFQALSYWNKEVKVSKGGVDLSFPWWMYPIFSPTNMAAATVNWTCGCLSCWNMINMSAYFL
jgi:hypothetical protein